MRERDSDIDFDFDCDCDCDTVVKRHADDDIERRANDITTAGTDAVRREVEQAPGNARDRFPRRR
jgi:hypothetical protein